MFSFLVSVRMHISVSISTLGSLCAFKNGETKQRKTFYSHFTFNSLIALREQKHITFLQRFSNLSKQKLCSIMHPPDTFKGTSPQSWVFSTRLIKRSEGGRSLEADRLGSQALPLATVWSSAIYLDFRVSFSSSLKRKEMIPSYNSNLP